MAEISCRCSRRSPIRSRRTRRSSITAAKGSPPPSAKRAGSCTSSLRWKRWAGKLPPEALLATRPGEPLPWLYDLQADIGETRNVAAEHPEIVERLRIILEETDATLTREARGK